MIGTLPFMSSYRNCVSCGSIILHSEKEWCLEHIPFIDMVLHSIFCRPSTEAKSGTPKKKKHCNCRNSKCLKMYCECFQEQQFCDGCNCSNCGNIVGNEKARQEAINAIVQRNPLAFQPKIENGPSTHNVRKVPSSPVVHLSHILEKFIPVWREIIFLPIISETENTK